MPDREREAVVASLQVLINGNRIPPEAEADLFLLEVADELDTIGMFTLSLNAGDPKSGGVKWIDTDQFREGNEVKIKMGFHAPLPDMLVGEITALEPEFPERGPILLTVRGYDRLYRLGYGRKSRSFRNMKDSDIAAQIARDWKLTPEVEDTTVTHEYLFQNNQTDLAFLLERAHRIRYEVKVEGKSLFFRKPQETRGKLLTLTYGETLLSFTPRLTLLSQIGETVVQGWSPKEKKAIRGRAGPGDETSPMGGKETGPAAVERLIGKAPLVVVDDPPATPEDAEIMAKGQLNATAFEFLTGEGSCVGEPQIRAGMVIELRELGKRFSGLYYVTSSTHSLSVRRGYITTFSVGRSAA